MAKDNKLRVEMGGEMIPLIEAAKKCGVPYPTAYARFKMGKPIGEPGRLCDRVFEWGDQKMAFWEWAKFLGVPLVTLRARYRNSGGDLNEVFVPGLKPRGRKPGVYTNALTDETKTLSQWAEEWGVHTRTAARRMYKSEDFIRE